VVWFERGCFFSLSLSKIAHSQSSIDVANWLCGLDHRQRQRQRDKLRLLLGGAAVSDSNYDRKRGLECLRLASDLKQLAKDTLNPDLKAHFLRMAEAWSGEAEKNPAEYAWAKYTGVQSALYH
jgi:hypothetical protein